MLNIKVKKLDSRARAPQFAHPGDAGMDIYTLEKCVIDPGQVQKIKTGIALEIPEGYVGLCWDRSGLATNHSLKVVGGVIDSGYRGEVMVGIINLGSEPYSFSEGDRIAQMLIQKVERPGIAEAEELSETPRGEGGFGSTGK